jgi:two-component system CheB/CheR fusion protein
LPIGIVTVDRSYDIHWLGGAARRLLAIHGSAIGQDFLHLATRLPATDVRAGIDAAFRGETSTRVLESPAPELPVPRRWLSMTFLPHGDVPSDGPPELVLVVTSDVTESVEQLNGSALDRDAAEARAVELSDRIAELTRSNTDLVAANDELAGANAELRRANEELLVANEEVQAATEEVETLNEELQATNEELETLNEELQATVEELNTTNDDLEARSSELQDSAASLEVQRRSSEAARARLEAVLTSMTAPVLFVARDGTLLTNPAYESQIGSEEAIVGEDRKARSSGPGLRARAAKGESFRVIIVASDPGGARRRFVADGRPVRLDGATQGGVIVFQELPGETD